MDIDLKNKWVEALRSGKYQQGKGLLRSGTDKFCCLGVLCDVLGEGWKYNEKQKAFQLTDPIHHWAGIGQASGFLTPEFNKKIGLPEGMCSYLAGQNDQGRTFEEIADIIDAAGLQSA